MPHERFLLYHPRFRRIPKVSARTRIAVRRLERNGLGRNTVFTAIDLLTRYLSFEGRWLPPPGCSPCPGCDPTFWFDDLADALPRLPRAAREDLARLVDPLVEDFLRRTLPEPVRPGMSDLSREPWWYRRLMGW